MITQNGFEYPKGAIVCKEAATSVTLKTHCYCSEKSIRTWSTLRSIEVTGITDTFALCEDIQITRRTPLL